MITIKKTMEEPSKNLYTISKLLKNNNFEVDTIFINNDIQKKTPKFFKVFFI